jgi:hypothetical protein
MARALPIVLALLAGCLIWIAVDQAQLVSPTPENESAFLKSYTEKKVIDRFKAAEYYQQSMGTSDDADRGFATHGEDFEPVLVINAGDWVPLMQAL